MNTHWKKIIYTIEQEYNIKSSEDWLANESSTLKKLHTALELKIKSLVVKNMTVAKAYLSTEVFYTYKDLAEEEKIKALEDYIIDNKLIRKLNMDIRVLKEKLNSPNPPSHTKIRDAFSIYVYDSLYEHLPRLEEATEQNIIPPHKVQQFYNSHFWVYYFHYEENTNHHKIGKAILNINKKGKVTLQNVDDETASDFIGKFKIENSNQHLYIELVGKQTKEKHLRITIFIGLGKVYPIYIGVYTNIYSNNSMVAGSIVFEKIEGDAITQNMQPKSYLITEAISKGIDPAIVNFLKERERNFLKTPSGILTLYKLNEWKKIQQHKSKKKA